MSYQTKVYNLNDDVRIKVILTNYYIILNVCLIFEKIVDDKLVETYQTINAPYEKFKSLIDLCLKYGSEFKRNT